MRRLAAVSGALLLSFALRARERTTLTLWTPMHPARAALLVACILPVCALLAPCRAGASTPTSVNVVLSRALTIWAAEISREEALALAFPGATIRPEQVFLTAEQRKLAADRAGDEIPSALVARYVAMMAGRSVGRAYVDTNIVRTKRETLLISVDAAGRVKRVDVTAFLELAEYRAPDGWLRQYQDRELTDDVSLNRAIRPIAGATLTARAVNAAVRRVLAIDEVLESGVGK